MRRLTAKSISERSRRFLPMPKGKGIHGGKLMNIKDIRKLTNLSQEKFAKVYHIPKRTLENWESESKANKRSCPRYVLELLERAVKLDVANGVIEKKLQDAEKEEKEKKETASVPVPEQVQKITLTENSLPEDPAKSVLETETENSSSAQAEPKRLFFRRPL